MARVRRRPAMPQRIDLDDMSWAELQDHLRAGRVTAHDIQAALGRQAVRLAGGIHPYALLRVDR